MRGWRRWRWRRLWSDGRDLCVGSRIEHPRSHAACADGAHVHGALVATGGADFGWIAASALDQRELCLIARAAEVEGHARLELVDRLVPVVLIDLDTVHHDQLARA